MQLRASLSERPPYRKFLIIVGLTLVGAVLFTALATLLCQALFGIDMNSAMAMAGDRDDPQLASAFRLFQLLAAIGTFIVPSWLAALLFSHDAAQYLGMKVKPAVSACMLAAGILIVAIPLINWMMQLNSSLHLPASMQSLEAWMLASEKQAEKITGLMLGTASWSTLLVNLLVIAVVPAIGEELLFRAVIQKQFIALMNNRVAAVIFTSILFSALHMQFYGFLPRFALGIFLGFLYLQSGSIWLPVWAHFFNNAAAVILTWTASRQKISFNPDTIGTEPGQWVMLVFSMVLTGAGLWWFQRQGEAEKG